MDGVGGRALRRVIASRSELGGGFPGGFKRRFDSICYNAKHALMINRHNGRHGRRQLRDTGAVPPPLPTV